MNISLLFIFALIILIIMVIFNNSETFVPPKIEELDFIRMGVKEEPVIEEPVIEEPVIEEPVIEEPVIEEPVINYINQDDSIPPNYNLKENRDKSNCLNSDSIYRINSGRQPLQQEQYVSIYDSNFGGLLGTQMGLK